MVRRVFTERDRLSGAVCCVLDGATRTTGFRNRFVQRTRRLLSVQVFAFVQERGAANRHRRYLTSVLDWRFWLITRKRLQGGADVAADRPFSPFK